MEWANECVTGDSNNDDRAHLDKLLAEALNRFGVFKGEESRKAPAHKKQKRA